MAEVKIVRYVGIENDSGCDNYIAESINDWDTIKDSELKDFVEFFGSYNNTRYDKGYALIVKNEHNFEKVKDDFAKWKKEIAEYRVKEEQKRALREKKALEKKRQKEVLLAKAREEEERKLYEALKNKFKDERV